MFTLFVTPTVYTFIARDHRAAQAKQAVAESDSLTTLPGEQTP
jgi:hypothetical protein